MVNMANAQIWTIEMKAQLLKIGLKVESYYLKIWKNYHEDTFL